MRSDGLPCGAWLRWGAVGFFFHNEFYRGRNDFLYLLVS